MKRLILILALLNLGGSLPSLKYRALDNDGDPISGAKIYFYTAGTTTPLATYPTEADEIAGTNANANPVVCDSNGWCGEIFLQTDQTYKVVMKSSDAATTYFTVDNINAGQLTSSAFQARLQQAATNPLDYGAVGDGVADESTEVQAAIDAATGVVDLLGKTYRCDSTLLFDTGQNGVVVKNGTLDFSQSNSHSYITAVGSLGTSNALTSSATIGATTLAVTSVSGIAADTWLLLLSGDTWASGVYLGELVQIDSIASLDISLKSPIEAGYTTGNSAAVLKVTPVTGLRFENVKIIASTSASGNGDAVYLQYTEDISFSHCTFEGFKRYGIYALYSIGLTIEDCVFEQSGSSGAAVYAINANHKLTVHNSHVKRIPTGVMLGITGNYQTRYARIVGNQFDGVTQAVVAGLSTQYLSVIDNDIIGDTSGGSGTGDCIEILSPDFRVEKNNIRECGGNGILVDTDAVTYASGKDLSAVITDNRIWEPDNACIDVEAASSPALSSVLVSGNVTYGGTTGISVYHDDAVIAGNSISGQSGIGIDVADVNNVQILDNKVDGATNSAGIFIGTATATRENVLIDGNFVLIGAAGTSTGIGVNAGASYSIGGVTISNNTIDVTPASSAVTGIDILAGADPVIVGNNINGVAGTLTNGILCTAIPANYYGTAIVGNRIKATNGISGGGSTCGYMTITGNSIWASDGIIGIFHATTISGNYIWATTAGSTIAPTAASGLVISGNMLKKVDDTDDNIKLDGSGAGTVTNVVIEGNYIQNGEYGVGEPTDANNTNVSIGLNTWLSLATGEYEGTVTPATVALSAANTACNTTCGTLSCLYGFDEATTGVDCADAFADYCICYP